MLVVRVDAMVVDDGCVCLCVFCCVCLMSLLVVCVAVFVVVCAGC